MKQRIRPCSFISRVMRKMLNNTTKQIKTIVVDGGGGSKNLSCFKCDRVGHLTKEWKYDKKENGDDLNNKAARDKLYQERADIKQAK